jgi:nucleoid-associated protein YgaU
MSATKIGNGPLFVEREGKLVHLRIHNGPRPSGLSLEVEEARQLSSELRTMVKLIDFDAEKLTRAATEKKLAEEAALVAAAKAKAEENDRIAAEAETKAKADAEGAAKVAEEEARRKAEAAAAAPPEDTTTENTPAPK